MQTFCNTEKDCKWLLETHFKPSNLNNEMPFVFKSFCIMGNEDCPTSILIYRLKHPTVLAKDSPAKAMLCENGKYSFTNCV